MSARNPPQPAMRFGDLEFIVPPDAPAWCSDLAMGEDEARRVIEHYERCTIGPNSLSRKGKYVAAVQVRKPGQPFVTFGSDQRCSGIYGRWADAAAALVQLCLAYENERGRR